MAEIYDPTNQTWTDTGAMPTAEPFGVAVTLANGDVLDLGGGTTTVDQYNPTTSTWTPTGSLPVATTDPTATLLPDGQVLVAGGAGNKG